MKIKNMSKRFISVFLSLMMCVSLLQVPAFAAVDPVTGEEIPDNVIGDVINTGTGDADKTLGEGGDANQPTEGGDANQPTEGGDANSTPGEGNEDDDAEDTVPVENGISLLSETTTVATTIAISALQDLIDTTEVVGGKKEITLKQDVFSESLSEGITVGEGVNLVLNLAGHTIQGIFSDPTANNSLFTVNGTLTIQDTVGGGKITTAPSSDSSENAPRGTGRAVLVTGGTFNLKGGTITQNAVTGGKDMGETKANTHGNQTANGGGVYVNGGTFNMSGGTISENYAGDENTWVGLTGDEYTNLGGGVFVRNNGTVNLSGGIIENNHASEGGGVFSFYRSGLNETSPGSKNYYKSFFNMTGGTVQGNIAHTGEGGGIYIQGVGDIRGGEILDNETHTKADLGGGGVYVESDGKLTLINAIITENYANGLGGGFAACLHGVASMVGVSGAAIYRNHNQTDFSNLELDGWTCVDGWKTHGYASNAKGKIDGSDNLWDGENSQKYTWKNDEDFQKAAKDVFSAGGSADSTKNGAIFGNRMIGGGLENWSGKFVDRDGNPSNVDSFTTPIITSNNFLALTADPTQKSIDLALAARKDNNGVLIQGNKSLYTHGGGVATNGLVTIGYDIEKQYKDTPSLDITKVLENIKNVDGDTGDHKLAGNDFAFSLYSDENCTQEGKIVTDTNDKEGDASFNIPAKYLDTTNLTGSVNDDGTTTYTFTFYVKEDGSATGKDDETITYDPAKYKVTVEVIKKETTITDGGINIENLKDIQKEKVTIYSSSVTNIERLNAEGEVDNSFNWDNGNNKPFFKNGYTKPVIREEYNPLSLSLEKVFKIVGEYTGGKTFSFNVTSDVAGEKSLIDPVTVSFGDVSEGTHSQGETIDFDVDTISKLVENGTIKVDFDEDGSGTGNFVFYVSEQNGGKTENGLTYSSDKYQVTVPVTATPNLEKVTEIIDGIAKDFMANVTSYTFGVATYKTVDAVADDGSLKLGDAQKIQFTNNYEKPEEPVYPTPLVVYDPLKLSIQKIFSVVNGTAPTEAQFTFNASGIDNDFTSSATVSLEQVKQGNNTASADLWVRANQFNDDGSLKNFSFQVTEKNDGMENVTYSGYTYTVSLEGRSTTGEDGLVHYYYFPTITCTENGNAVTNGDVMADIANNILTFTNVFNQQPTTPDNPGGGGDRPRNPDPETPTTPTIPDEEVPLGPAPEEPEVTVPDEEVPLAPQPEVPEVTLPEPEVPLAPMPPETTTIPEPEVPLAGVPQTGDGSGAWFALMALAACGLVVLNLRKKENEI